MLAYNLTICALLVLKKENFLQFYMKLDISIAAQPRPQEGFMYTWALLDVWFL